MLNFPKNETRTVMNRMGRNHTIDSSEPLHIVTEVKVSIVCFRKETNEMLSKMIAIYSWDWEMRDDAYIDDYTCPGFIHSTI